MAQAYEVNVQDLGEQFPLDATEAIIRQVQADDVRKIVAALRRPNHVKMLSILAPTVYRRPSPDDFAHLSLDAIAALCVPSIENLRLHQMYVAGPAGAEVGATPRGVYFCNCLFSPSALAWALGDLHATWLYFALCWVEGAAVPQCVPWSGVQTLIGRACTDTMTQALTYAVAHARALVNVRLHAINAPAHLYLEKFRGPATIEKLKLRFANPADPVSHDAAVRNIVQQFPNLQTLVLGAYDLTESAATMLGTLAHLRTLVLKDTLPLSDAAVCALFEPQLRAPTWTRVNIVVGDLGPPALNALVWFIRDNPYLTRLAITSSVDPDAQLIAAAENSAAIDISIRRQYHIDLSVRPVNSELRYVDPMQAMDACVVRAVITGPQRFDVRTEDASTVLYAADEAVAATVVRSARPNISLHNFRDKTTWWFESPRDARHFIPVRDAFSAADQAAGRAVTRQRSRIVVVPYVVENGAVDALYRPDRDLYVRAEGAWVDIRGPNGVSRAAMPDAWAAVQRAADALVLPPAPLIERVVELALMRADRPVLLPGAAEKIARDCDPGVAVPRDAPTMYEFASGALAVRLPALVEDLARQFANRITMPRRVHAHLARQHGARLATQQLARAVAPRAVAVAVFYEVARVGADVVPEDEALAVLRAFSFVFDILGTDQVVYRANTTVSPLLYRVLALLLGQSRERTQFTQLTADGRGVQFAYPRGTAVAKVVNGRVEVESITDDPPSEFLGSLAADLNNALKEIW